MDSRSSAAVCENRRDNIEPGTTGGAHQIVPRSILIPFILLTSCFALWGLANNMTDVLIAQFKKVFTLTDMQSGLVQTAFFGAYFCLALPSAFFIKRFSYKAGVLLGLGLFCTGALMFYPASQIMTYEPFLAALFVLASGLSILETSANPYIIAMGPQETATRRLNLAQAFNPIGSITGVLIGKYYILSQLHPATDAERVLMSADELGQIQTGELAAVMGPYVVVALVIVAVWLAIAFTRMPVAHDANSNRLDLRGSFARLLAKRHFVRGVLGQFFYVGAQVGCWSYTIRYVMEEVGGNEADASSYLLASIVLFSACRFICTALMKFISPAKLLGLLAAGAVLCLLLVMMVGGMAGIYGLIGVSACMSLMFPTIFGLSVHGLGKDTQFGGSCLIMAILGGAVLTAIMGQISDMAGIRMAFIIPLIGFIYLIHFGFKGHKA
jgi:FHS family L-fucose permease-like MFS transporter